MMHDQIPGSMKVLIMMNHNLSKLYHQKTKGIQILLLVTYIISWRQIRMIMNSKGLLIITLRMIFFLGARYVGENLGEDNIMQVLFEDLKEEFPVELEKYIRNHVVESSRIKGNLNDWAVKVMKVNTRAIRRLYRVRGIDRGYRL